MTVLPNGHLGNLYFGKRIHDREDFSYLLEMKQRPMTACVYEGNRKFSLEHLKLEYPVYGSSDYRYPAMEILQENGSRISDFTYVSYTIAAGKPKLQGLPATYTEKDEEAQTLCVKLKDEVTGIVLVIADGNSCRIARQPDTLLVVYIYIIDNVPVHFVVTTIICNDIRFGFIGIYV